MTNVVNANNPNPGTLIPTEPNSENEQDTTPPHLPNALRRRKRDGTNGDLRILRESLETENIKRELEGKADEIYGFQASKEENRSELSSVRARAS